MLLLWLRAGVTTSTAGKTFSQHRQTNNNISLTPFPLVHGVSLYIRTMRCIHFATLNYASMNTKRKNKKKYTNLKRNLMFSKVNHSKRARSARKEIFIVKNYIVPYTLVNKSQYNLIFINLNVCTIAGFLLSCAQCCRDSTAFAN